MSKGQKRESTLPAQVYYSDHYFSRRQLFSQMAQLNRINHLKPRSILEVGIGNGLVSEVLRGAGYEVTTMDINPALHPDVVGDILKIETLFPASSFDLVVACEVLEHLPFKHFDSIVAQLARITRNHLYMSLPTAQRILLQCVFGLKIPYVRKIERDLLITCRSKQVADEHFWEINSCKETSRKNIRKIFERHFNIVQIGHEIMHPYHNHIVLKKNP